jgi:DNA-binding LacI/PurR family transcriptional regulator
MTAISGVTHANEYQLTILPTSPDELPDILQTIPNRMVAGSILYAQEVTLDYAAVKRIIKRHPLVHMGGRLQSGLPSVVYDQKLATEQALQYLIDMGHTQIAFITGAMDLLDGLSRHDAYIETMTRNHLRIGPVAYGDFSGRSGEIAMTALLHQEMPFTAVFVSSDSMAAAAIHVLRKAGRRVPDDISVIGYDNFEGASYQYPPLTTITNNSAILGRMTAEYLFELMQNPDTPRQQRVLIPDLIIRESTHAPQS